MRTLSSELSALFATRRNKVWKVDLYTFTLSNGTIVRWTGSDVQTKFDGTTWTLGPGTDREKGEWSLGMGVADFTITLYPKDGVTVNGVPVFESLIRGDFDGASVEVARGFAELPTSTPTGVVRNYLGGQVAEVIVEVLEARILVESYLKVLDEVYPPFVYQAQCLNRLFDGTCGLDASSYRETGTVGATIADNRTSFTSSVTKAPAFDDHFRLGRLRFTSGDNSGKAQVIKGYDAATGTFSFARPWPAAIDTSDAFEVWPGCDKTLEMCEQKFDNRSRFRGFPFIPAAETTL